MPLTTIPAPGDASRVMLPTPISSGDDEPRQFPNLTELQERFVHEYVADPSSQERAAVRAGYSPASAHVTASRMLQKDAIIQAVTHATIRALGAAGPTALKQVISLSSRAKSEHVRLDASRDILDRLGMSAPKKVSLGGQLSVSFDLS